MKSSNARSKNKEQDNIQDSIQDHIDDHNKQHTQNPQVLGPAMGRPCLIKGGKDANKVEPNNEKEEIQKYKEIISKALNDPAMAKKAAQILLEYVEKQRK